MILIFITTTGTANPTCDDVLHKCDTALQAQIQLAADEQKTIDTQKKMIDDSNAWYRDPVKIFLLGLIVGVAGGVYIEKK